MTLREEQCDYLAFARRTCPLEKKSVRSWMKAFFDAVTDGSLWMTIDDISPEKKDGDYSEQTIVSGALCGLYGPNLNLYWNGKRAIPRQKAAQLYKSVDESGFDTLFDQGNMSIDPAMDMQDRLALYGIRVEKARELPHVMCQWLLGLLWDLAGGGLPENVRKHERVKSQHQAIASGRVYIENGLLRDEYSAVRMPPDIEKPAQLQAHESCYAQKILDAYADRDKTQPLTLTQVDQLGVLRMHFEQQRHYYFKAVSREKQLREIREDGGSDFETVKQSMFDAVFEVLSMDYANGYIRLNSTVNRAGQAELSESVVAQIPSLFGESVKKGVVHVLVNDTKIPGWVEHNHE